MDNPAAPDLHDKPMPPEMQALCAFNPDLASQALPQLYLDGHKDMALEWGLILDPFKNAHARPSSTPKEPALFSLGYRSTYGSLLDIALHHQDSDFIEALCSNPALKTGLFTDRLDIVANKAGECIAKNPMFASYLFERMAPKAKSESANYGDCLPSLAESACKNKKLAWLARIDEMHQIRHGSKIDGASLARKHFLTPLEVSGMGILLDLGCIYPNNLASFAEEFFKSKEPEHRTMGLRLLDAFHLSQIERTKIGPADPRYSQTYSSTAMHTNAHLTPVQWLGYFMDKGLDPFTIPNDGTLTCAASLLRGNWRENALYSSGKSDLDAGRFARNSREDDIMPLLASMLARGASPETLAIHMDLGSVGSEARAMLSGCRKVDYLGLCVVQGFYRCANLLAEAGADWKFSAKQSKSWLFSRSRHDEPDAKEQAGAYFESLLLKSTSVKSSARRDARAAKAGNEISPAPRMARL